MPQQPSWNKRLRTALSLVKEVMRVPVSDSDFWFYDHWVVGSTPVECGRSGPTAKWSNMAGWPGYGYRASHSRYFWCLRLFLVCTPTGTPILWSLANPKMGQREVPATIPDREPHLATDRPGLLLIADKGFAAKEFEAEPAVRGAELPRPSFRCENKRKGEKLPESANSRRSKLIESVNGTLKGEPDLEQHDRADLRGASPSALPSASSRWPPRSGRTTRSGCRSRDHRSRDR
ncbi:IS982 family transposase [Streptomyces sp. NPDC127039]|uniref:IS982 family transposase n=1 Tax=Streptomyces sp. NPDC127039 TaxID=3347115 RepID=UPI0036567A35